MQFLWRNTVFVMKNRIRIKKEQIILLLISIAAFVIRIGFKEDLSRDMEVCLLPWYDEISGMSLKTALSTQVGNYNFLYQLIIFLLTRIPGKAIYKYKLLSVIFDYVLAAGVFAFVRKTADDKKAALAYSITLILPTVWLNSAAWGQCDSIYVAFIVWSLYFLYTNKYIRSFVFLGISLAVKLQAVFIIPFFVFLYILGLINKEKKIRLYHFGIIPGTVIATALPNIFAGRPLTDMIGIYKEQIEKYQDIAKNYQTVWNILHFAYDSDAAWCIGFTVIALIVLGVFFYRKKADVWGKHFIWCAFLMSYTCVMFLPSMHERYAYLYEILAMITAFSYGINFIAAFAFQLISVKTYCSYLYGMLRDIDLLSIFNTVLYAFSIFAFVRELSEKPLIINLFDKGEESSYAPARFPVKERFKPGKKDITALLILTGIFLLIGSMHLGRKEAPETYLAFGTETAQGTEIYVSLDAYQDVGAVCIYPRMSGKESFELFYAEDGEWKKIEADTVLKGVFTWRRIDVNVRTHQFCIVFSDPKVEIAEVACLDPNGNRISLLEGSSPAEVFDEQDMIPRTPTAFDSMIFDEVYHGRTAFEFLNGMKIYENTHPPLGKTLISIGIRLFGMNPFGYRIIVLLFGVMCIPVMYLFVLRITGDSRYAILAGILQITEFMHYSLSRISTIDIIVAFFVMCMFYGCFAFIQEERRRYLLLSGAAFALGAATKWTAIYAAAGIAFILLVWMIVKIREHRKASYISGFVLICILCYMVLPAVVYVLSYVPFVKAYPNQNLIEHAVSNSIHMLDYHKNVTAGHPYASPWYSWIFDWLPLVDSRTIFGDYMGVVATFVNPFVCYAGLASVFHHVYLTFKKKDAASAVLVVLYVCMLLPWVFITRTVFIYQYFICTKVLILMICRSIQCIGFKNENSVIRFTGVVSIVLFVMYFPVLSGCMVKKEYIDYVLRALPNWWF